MFEGFTLQGRARVRLYLYNCFVPWRTLPEVLLHRRGEGFSYGPWRFSIPYGLVYIKEHANWNTDYMPPGGLRGKRVLDVGAGCGESAMWFLKEGAHRVHAVENNGEALRLLRENAWRVKGLSVSTRTNFDPSFHLLTDRFDLVKVDIEGYEVLFADWLKRNPEFNVDTVLEVHSVYLRDRFKELGFSEIIPSGCDPPQGFSTRIMYRWKK